jgi:hypothetical protein
MSLTIKVNEALEEWPTKATRSVAANFGHFVMQRTNSAKAKFAFDTLQIETSKKLAHRHLHLHGKMHGISPLFRASARNIRNYVHIDRVRNLGALGKRVRNIITEFSKLRTEF